MFMQPQTNQSSQEENPTFHFFLIVIETQPSATFQWLKYPEWQAHFS